jgi:hypothetical protein
VEWRGIPAIAFLVCLRLGYQVDLSAKSDMSIEGNSTNGLCIPYETFGAVQTSMMMMVVLVGTIYMLMMAVVMMLRISMMMRMEVVMVRMRMMLIIVVGVGLG